MKKCDSATGLTAEFAKESISKRTEVRSKTPEEALFFLLTNDLSKMQYTNLKKSSRESGYDIWPNYDYVRAAKLNLRPDNIAFANDKSISVPLQDLLDKSVSRLLLNNSQLFDKILDLASENSGELNIKLIFKIGFDSSGSHETPQQADSDGDHREIKHLMSTQLVLLQLATNDEEKISLHNFPGPNNAHSCRPVRLSYEKENTETIIKEYRRLRAEMSNLTEYVVHEHPTVKISYEGIFTLIDGKVLNAITGINSTCCPQCGQGRKELRKRDGVFEIIPENLEFGCSILHFGLRTFELLLKIAYKSEEKIFTAQEGKVDSAKFKEKISQKQKSVQKQFKTQLGLVVDKARPGSFGSTNTGNVARRAFANPVTTAAICGISPVLVSNLATIWRTLASGLEINSEAFGKFCRQTIDIYHDEKLGAPWYPMPPSLHRVLFHGQEIIENCPVPFGWTSEEGSEANNKFSRQFATNHARKTSSSDALSDLFHRLVDISDPVLVSSSVKEKKHDLANLPNDMKKMVFIPEDETSENEFVDNISDGNTSMSMENSEDEEMDFDISIENVLL
jgi:hypothetical protein